MASANGAAGKTTTRQASSKTVVPALPLNFPQRPANKQSSNSAVAPSPADDENGFHPTEKKATSPDPKDRQEPPVGNPAELGTNSAEDPDAATPSVTPVQVASKAEPSESVGTPDERAKDTPTILSAFPDRRAASPVRHRPPGPSDAASETPSTSGPVSEGPIAAAHPAIMSRPAFHQPHPSNGSLVFGGFHDSNTSSPAPRSGGSSFPPPGMLPPYPPVAAMDGYGRPLLVSPTLDGYPPNPINHHGPPTPHSFPGSQSSVQADERGFSPYLALNGHNGYPVDPAGPGPMPLGPMNLPMNGVVHAVPGSVSAYQGLRDQDEALAFLRHGLSDDTFHDCILEVRFPDNPDFQDHPGYHQLHHILRTHGHRFVLSRSPTLAGAMKAQGTLPGGSILLEVHDEYIRPDVFWYSLRTLYGWSLADGILPTELRLRDVKDDLKTALSYVATARYLRLSWVHSVAVHRAGRLLYWNTVELAVKFVSRIVATPSRNEGFGVSELLNQVLAFLIHNFPVDFVLDVNATDPGFPRLPLATLPPANPNAPSIARGTSGRPHSRQPSGAQTQMPRNPRVSSNLRLSQIKFGDMSPPKNVPGGSSDVAPATRSPTPNDTILSRILLNLPFELLKQILEHPLLGKLSGELSPSSRQTMVADIIAERESRRLRALERADPKLRVYQERVENAAAPLVVGNMDDFWVNSMGFKEEVFSGDLPFLVHTWTQGSAGSIGN